jgi:23S rRNA (cytosine1962-C5)-methyltransferase
MTAKSRVTIPTGLNMTAREMSSLFLNAIRKREILYRVTNAVRLFNSAGDGLPGLIVEQYNKHFMLKKLQPIANLDISPVIEALTTRFNPRFVVVKTRNQTTSQTDTSSVVIGEEASATMVTENGLNFRVDLNDNFNTGLFLDMRSKRQMIGELSCGKVILNTFAYTCSFGLYSRYYGATKTVNVDISKKGLERGQANYTFNQLSYEQDEFVRTDSLKYLKGARKWKNYFDIIILDPPTFARVDKQVFSAQKQFPELIQAALAVLKPEGYLLVATNCSNLNIKIVESIIQEATRTAKRRLADFVVIDPEEDFPGSNDMKESHLIAILVKFN